MTKVVKVFRFSLKQNESRSAINTMFLEEDLAHREGNREPLAQPWN